MGRHQKSPYPLRLPDDLEARIKQSAAEGGRTLREEIIRRLETSFDGAPPLEQRVGELERRVAELENRIAGVKGSA